jgi:hypothetical protein
VVAHGQLDVGVEVRADDLQAARPGGGLDAVAHRVLDERLQREHRHDRGQHLGRDVDAHLEAVAEARPFEPQVLLDVVQLVGQRHVGAVAAERVAGELGELGQQLTRLVGARVDRVRHGGERVVDEVRRDLRAQRAELGVR